VSLYGLFEQLVEGLIREYATRLQDACPKYVDLPERLRNANAEMTVELLPKLEFSRYKGRLQIPQVIANLHSCLSGADTYLLNLEALQQHSANFRSDVLAQLFTRIGIEQVLQRLSRYEPFTSFMSARFEGKPVASIPNEQVYAQLNDLAERRNDVAHGVTSDILSIPILLDIISYTLALGRPPLPGKLTPLHRDHFHHQGA
jgi:hypothetical protein